MCRERKRYFLHSLQIKENAGKNRTKPANNNWFLLQLQKYQCGSAGDSMTLFCNRIVSPNISKNKNINCSKIHFNLYLMEEIKSEKFMLSTDCYKLHWQSRIQVPSLFQIHLFFVCFEFHPYSIKNGKRSTLARGKAFIVSKFVDFDMKDKRVHWCFTYVELTRSMTCVKIRFDLLNGFSSSGRSNKSERTKWST